ncbi:MAG TPA: hypothetical protein VIF83_05565 [Gemmatimonadaceae bacterium]
MRRFRAIAAAMMSLAALSYGCGGGGKLFGPEEALTYSASTRVIVAAPTRFETGVTLTNPTSTAVTVRIGCGPFIVVYATSARSGTPVYDSGANTVCTANVVDVTLQPGGTKTYTATATTTNILGASGAVGTYYITAVMPVGAATVVLPAGQVDLRR